MKDKAEVQRVQEKIDSIRVEKEQNQHTGEYLQQKQKELASIMKKRQDRISVEIQEQV